MKMKMKMKKVFNTNDQKEVNLKNSINSRFRESVKLLFFMWATLNLLTGCSSMVNAVVPQKAFKKDEVKTIKTVAIVSFDVMQVQPTGLASQVVGSSIASIQTGTNYLGVADPIAANLYQRLSSLLESERKMKVISLQDVLNNSVYQEIVASKKESTQNLQSVNNSQKGLIIKGLIRPSNPTYQFTAAERARLIEALKVDGLILSRLSLSIKQNDYLGLGMANIYLQPSMSFYLYSASQEKPIWFDHQFVGSPSSESIGKVRGLEDSAKINSLSIPLGEATIATMLKQNPI